MKIGIDARLIGQTGVGRYIRNLLSQLAILDTRDDYVVFLRSEEYESFVVPNKRWTKVRCDIPWHSVAEQLVLPVLLLWHRLDLVHIPYFTIPILYPKKFVVTMHDVTILHIKTGRATTHSREFYEMKRIGYKIVLKIGLMRAHTIITVSQTIKDELVKFFGIDPSRIEVTYEGVDEKLTTHLPAQTGNSQPTTQTSYILYVGNVYPHKNAEILIDAFCELGRPDRLVFVGKRDIFYDRLIAHAEKNGAHRIEFLGAVSDGELSSLYAGATAFVFPSLMEGFGLPGLEAMRHGTPVVCSDIPVFHEIYGDAPYYFDPNDKEILKDVLLRLLGDAKERQSHIRLGLSQAARYSWKAMAAQTLKIYQTGRDAV